MISPQNLLPNQMIVTPAPSWGSVIIGHQSTGNHLMGNSNILKAVESLIVIAIARNQISWRIQIWILWMNKTKHFIEYFLPLQTPLLLLTPGNLIWTPQDKGLQCNAASNAWKRKSLRLPGRAFLPLLPLLFHSPLDPWEITLNPNFLRRPVCYSCLENPSLSST